MAHAEPSASEEAAIDRRVDAEREQRIRCAKCRRWDDPDQMNVSPSLNRMVCEDCRDQEADKAEIEESMRA